MPTVAIKAFDGLKPITDPILLDNGAATVAKNVKLISGALAPLKNSTTLKALTKTAPQTIFRYGSSANENEYWLEFLARTDVMRSPIVDNQYGMLYWSDGVAVKYAPNNLILSGGSYPGASYTLGVPAPDGGLHLRLRLRGRGATLHRSRHGDRGPRRERDHHRHVHRAGWCVQHHKEAHLHLVHRWQRRAVPVLDRGAGGQHQLHGHLRPGSTRRGDPVG